MAPNSQLSQDPPRTGRVVRKPSKTGGLEGLELHILTHYILVIALVLAAMCVMLTGSVCAGDDDGVCIGVGAVCSGTDDVCGSGFV